MAFGSLFAGCGGGDLGLEMAGMKCRWQVEIDPKCRRVLQKHWPEVPRFADIHDVGRHNLEPVDLIIGGFPCQPFSSAGKQRGKEDDRYLWPEMRRVVEEIRPAWVIGENSPGIDRLALEEVLSDMESIGYEVAPLEIPACAVDADNIRFRTWILGYTNHHKGKPEMPVNDEASRLSPTVRVYAECRDGSLGGDAARIGRIGKSLSGNGSGEREDTTGGLGEADDVPGRMDRLRMLGNAMVPELVAVIGRAIQEIAR